MRKAMLFFAVFGLAGSLFGADPIIGTWKLNDAQSKFSEIDPTLKEYIEVYRELNSGLIEYTQIYVDTKGSSESIKFTWPRQGGIVKAPENYTTSYVVTLIAPGDWYLTVLLDGKQIGQRHKVISKDGKTMRQTFKGMDLKGKPYDGLHVLEKQ